jgi:hypothetical protein
MVRMMIFIILKRYTGWSTIPGDIICCDLNVPSYWNLIITVIVVKSGTLNKVMRTWRLCPQEWMNVFNVRVDSLCKEWVWSIFPVPSVLICPSTTLCCSSRPFPVDFPAFRNMFCTYLEVSLMILLQRQRQNSNHLPFKIWIYSTSFL